MPSASLFPKTVFRECKSNCIHLHPPVYLSLDATLYTNGRQKYELFDIFLVGLSHFGLGRAARRHVHIWGNSRGH